MNWLVSVGEEDGAGLVAERLDVVDAVLLFVWPGELMALDATLLVVGDGAYGHDARLRATRALQLVEVVAGRRIIEIGAVGDAFAQKLRRARIDLGRIHVLAWGKLRLGPIDVRERERPLLHVGRCLVAVEDVVWRGGNFGCNLRGRSRAGKR